jgi:hypothetical protein
MLKQGISVMHNKEAETIESRGKQGSELQVKPLLHI